MEIQTFSSFSSYEYSGAIICAGIVFSVLVLLLGIKIKFLWKKDPIDYETFVGFLFAFGFFAIIAFVVYHTTVEIPKEPTQRSAYIEYVKDKFDEKGVSVIGGRVPLDSFSTMLQVSKDGDDLTCIVIPNRKSGMLEFDCVGQGGKVDLDTLVSK